MRAFQVVLFLALLPVSGWGQTNFLYHEISEIQTNEMIKGIVRDSTGFIWLATDQGVLKYDGTETTLFFDELPNPFTKKFLNTSSGHLLVLSDWRLHEVIEERDSVRFTSFSLGEHVFDQKLNYPKSIYEDTKGNIWIGEVNGIVRINESGFKRYLLGQDFQSISYHRTFSFAEDAFGHLWVAPFKGPVLSYNEQRDVFEPVDINFPLSEVTSIEAVKGDYLLVGGNEGIFKLKVDSDKQVLESAFIEGVKNVSLLTGDENAMFVGTWDNGLFQFHFDLNTFNKVDEVAFNDIVDYYVDQSSGDLWIAGSENVGLLSPSVISAIGEAGRYRIESFTMEDNKIFFSTGQEIHTIQFDQESPVSSLIIESENNYFDWVEAKEGDLWIGDSFGAIYKLDMSSNDLKKIKDSTSYQPIKYIYEDSQHNLWFAGEEDYLIQINEKDELVLHPEVNATNVLAESPTGRLFCGASGIESFLYLYNPDKAIFEPVRLQLNFAATDVYVEDMAFSPEGDLWLATNYGLLSVGQNLDKVSHVEVTGLPYGEAVKAVAYLDGVLWVASNRGLSALGEDQSVLFTNVNGLPSKIIKERGLKVYHDQLMIATAKGLAKIDPKVEIFRKTPSPIFRQVIAGQQQVQENQDQIALPFNGGVQVEYLTLSYPVGGIQYQSRMVGLEDKWSEPSSNRIVSFLGFSEGDYVLEVRAKDVGYLWSDAIRLHITVARPWYRSWWAYLIALVVAFVIIGLSIRVYHYRLILQKRKLKQIIEQRTSEINRQKNEIIEQKNRIIQQKEELIEKNNAYHRSQQALSEADVNFLQLKEKQLRDQIEYRNKQITTHTLNIIQKNETLKDLRAKLEGLIKSADKASQAELKKTLKIIDESFKLDKDWEEFKLFFEQIYTGFYTKLKINCPALTTQELRHCALIRLNLSLAECASILGISPDSVKVSRARIRKKLDLEQGQGLTDFILSV